MTDKKVEAPNELEIVFDKLWHENIQEFLMSNDVKQTARVLFFSGAKCVAERAQHDMGTLYKHNEELTKMMDDAVKIIENLRIAVKERDEFFDKMSKLLKAK